MPAYDYDCAACGRRFEVSHGVHADPPTACPLCGSGPIRKAISAPTIHYKGSGWAKKERRATASPNSSRPATDGSAGDGGSGDGGSGDGASGESGSGDGRSGGGTSEGEATTSDESSKPAKQTKAAIAATTD